MSFYPLEKLMNLYDGFQRSYLVAGQSLLLVQEEGRCYLLLNQCPHQQAPFVGNSSYGSSRGGPSAATIMQGHIRCSVHGMAFSLATGKTTDGCQQSLQFLPIVYEGNQLGVVL